MQLQLLLLLKLMLLTLFGVSGHEAVLLGEDAYDAGGDFVVGDRLVVFSDNIDPEFMLQVRNIV
jgi:hypothetical protein